MRPPTEDDLILYYYGEAPRPAEIEKALSESPELAARYQELRSVLDAIPELEVPEPGPDFTQRTLSRLRTEIESPRREWRSRLEGLLEPRWALAAAAVLLVVVSFLAGRFSSVPLETTHANPSQKILLVTVASHLERSEILLLELANAPTADSENSEALDLSVERLLAQELSSANRLYRQAARKAGEQRVAAILDDLERLLVELAHAPEELEAERLAELQRRLEEADLLFKIRVVGSRLRHLTEPDDNSPST